MEQGLTPESSPGGEKKDKKILKKFLKNLKKFFKKIFIRKKILGKIFSWINLDYYYLCFETLHDRSTFLVMLPVIIKFKSKLYW